MAVAPMTYMKDAKFAGGLTDFLAFVFSMSSSIVKSLGVAELGPNVLKIQTARTLCIFAVGMCPGIYAFYHALPFDYGGPNDYNGWYLANRQRPVSNTSFREMQHMA